MANEITIQSNMKLANGNAKYPGDKTSYPVTQSTARPATLMGTDTRNVSTAVALTIPGVASGNLGWTKFYNNDPDPSKYIDIGPQSDGATIEVAFRVYGGGPPAQMQLIPSVTYWAVASSGTQVLEILAFAK